MWEWERSALGNWFIGIDGEGTVGDEYALLDSSLDDYPRLYTGQRLTTMQCLDWLWGLGKYSGYSQFALYGARYDYDNWMRDLTAQQLQFYAASQPVYFGPYVVLWQPGYKWVLRKTRSTVDGKRQYERIQTRNGQFGNRVDKIQLVLWDVLPWWQGKFEEAVKNTLGDRAINPQLISEGKAQRGSFTHENIEWVSEYNHTECRNLALMCNELDAWLHSVNIVPRAYNGPGAAAKYLLALHEPFRHSGRRVLEKGRTTSRKVREYQFPGWTRNAALTAALSAYAGGRNQLRKIGYRPGVSWQYDINGAYPAATADLPCLTHGRWKRTTTFDPSSFGLWRLRYKATRSLPMYPFFFRIGDGSIIYPSSLGERWAYTCEVEAAMTVDPDGIGIREGWVWEPDICDSPYPLWWISHLGAVRLTHKKAGRKGAANGLKLPLNSIYGSIAQARGGSVAQPPWSQQILWAGWITAWTRAKLYLAAMLDPDGALHLATDGLICENRLPLLIGDGLGEWEESKLTDLTLAQYGVYFANEKSRYRGFMVEDVSQLVADIHTAWQSQWRSVAVKQRMFVTSSLVTSGQHSYDEWCRWFDVPRVLSLDIDTPYEMGSCQGLDKLYPVSDMTSYYGVPLEKSELYKPKWGAGGDFADENALDEACNLWALM